LNLYLKYTFYSGRGQQKIALYNAFVASFSKQRELSAKKRRIRACVPPPAFVVIGVAVVGTNCVLMTGLSTVEEGLHAAETTTKTRKTNDPLLSPSSQKKVGVVKNENVNPLKTVALN